jgi:pimeloyl-ACP methyl ester carboxylesterase
LSRYPTENPAGFVEHRFDARAVHLNYAEGPDHGPPLVMVHGLGRRWQVFYPLFPALSGRWHIFAPDLRGHGQSSRIPRGYHGFQYAADIVRFLRDRVAAPSVFFGHSLGGMVGMWIAANEPELVRALIVGDSMISTENFDTSMYPELFTGLCEVARRGGSIEEVASSLARIQLLVPGLDERVPIGDLPGNDEDTMRWWARCVKQADPDTYAMSIDGSSLEGWDGPALLRKIKCPTLLLQASPELGGLMSDADVKLAMKTLAQPAHVKFETLGHALYMQQAEPVLQAINRFLASL